MKKIDFVIGNLYEFDTTVQNIFLCLDKYKIDTQDHVLFLHLRSNKKMAWKIEMVEDRFSEFAIEEI